MLILLMLFLTGCTPTDGSDGRGMGGWVTIQSPPGHPEQECWAWVHAEGLQTGFGGPQCFDKVPKPLTKQESEIDQMLQTPEGRAILAEKLLGPESGK